MNFSTHVKPISYFKSHAADIVKTLSDTREPMLITQNGEARLVVMDVGSYEEREATLALLKILVQVTTQSSRASSARRKTCSQIWAGRP